MLPVAAGSVNEPQPACVSTSPTIPKLSLDQIRVRLAGREVLCIERLQVGAGEVLAVLGPNGAGKSTLLQLCGFLLAPDSGAVTLDGQAIRGAPLQARRRATMLLQSPVMVERSVLGNVVLGQQLRGVPRRDRERLGLQWLERFGVAHLAGRSARALSGGEAQRVALARALAFTPEIVLLDEPFNALDQPSRETLVAEALHELRRLGATTIFATHDRTEALTFADRLLVLVDGRIRQQGTPAELLANPADSVVAAFLGVGSSNQLAG